jgi:hypothetical protein
MKENITEQVETTASLLARLEWLLMQRDEKRLPELQAKCEKLVGPVQEAKIAYEEAEKILVTTTNHYHLIEQELSITQWAIDGRKQQIEMLIRENPDTVDPLSQIYR